MAFVDEEGNLYQGYDYDNNQVIYYGSNLAGKTLRPYTTEDIVIHKRDASFCVLFYENNSDNLW